MKPSDASRPFEGAVSGTPLDYSEDLYRFYLEIADADGAERVLRGFLGSRHAQRLQRFVHGFEFVVPIQCIPDLMRLLTQENIAVYQLVRQEKGEGTWR